MRKLTKREKISLSVLLALGLGYVYVQYLVIPQFGNIKEVRAELDESRAELEKVKDYDAKNQELVELLEADGKKLDKALKRNFTELKQEDIIMLVSKLTGESGLVDQGMNFKKPSQAEVGGEKLKLNAAELSFQGDYQGLNRFLEKLSKYEKRIIVDKIDIEKDEDDNLTGTVQLKLYSLENVVSETKSLFKWDQKKNYKASDPFNPFSSYVATIKRQEREAEEKEKEEEEKTKKESEKTSSSSTSTSSNSSNGNKTSTSSNSGSSSNSSTSSKPSTSTSTTTTPTPTPTPIPVPVPVPTPTPTPTPAPVPEIPNTLVESFENSWTFFTVGLPKNEVSSSLALNSDKTEGNNSLSLKYNFLNHRKSSSINLGFINEISVKSSYAKLTIDIKPLTKTTHKLGIVMTDSKGKVHDIELAKAQNWTGWKTIEVEIPKDASFPVSFQRIYAESTDYGAELEGNILMDKLKLTD